MTIKHLHWANINENLDQKSIVGIIKENILITDWDAYMPL